MELSTGTERTVRAQLNAKLEGEGEREYDRLLRAFQEAGGEEDDFEDPVDWDAIEENIENIMAGLKSRDPAAREAATAEAIALGVDPRLVLSAQLLNNSGYRRHSEKLPDLEKRARLLSAEYREVQKSRPIDVVPVADDRGNDAQCHGSEDSSGEGGVCSKRAQARTERTPGRASGDCVV